VRLFLIRHGQTAWNAGQRAQGHSDVPLDETGHQQVEALADHFASLGPLKTLTSDLVRAHQTARAITKRWNQEPESWPELRERSFGEWEGQPFSAFQAALAADYYALVPPGGESFQMTWDRVHQAATRLRTADEDVIVVTHGGTAGMLLAHLLGGSLETGRAFRFGNASVTELHRRPDQSFVMVRYNDVSFLSVTPRQGDTDGSR
jgi:broad specificity phosphatase PhoE